MSSKLKNKLNQWVDAQIITSDQANKIQEHENLGNDKSAILIGFLVLGALCLGIGVISLIASNWAYIPDNLKLICYFALLTGTGSLYYFYSQNKKRIYSEGALLLFMILIMAGIGLIAQVYHLNGPFYGALFLWSGLTFLCMILARSIFPPLIWCLVFCLALFTFFTMNHTATEITEKHLMIVLFSSLSLSFASLTLLTKRFFPTTPHFTVFFIVACFAFICLIGLAELVQYEYKYRSTGKNAFLYLTLPFIFYWVFQGLLFTKTVLKPKQKIILSITSTLMLMTTTFPFISSFHSYLYALNTIFAGTLIALFLASMSQLNAFRLMILALGLRFLIVYFQAFGSLATTGVGLILCGIFIITMVILWNKYHKKLAVWAEEVTR